MNVNVDKSEFENA